VQQNTINVGFMQIYDSKTGSFLLEDFNNRARICLVQLFDRSDFGSGRVLFD